MEKKGMIEFGYANEKNPSGSWEGITFGDENGIAQADFLGIVESNGNLYVITKVAEAMNQEVEGTFFVVDATVKTYDDGSGIVFVDQTQSDVAKKVQEGLNSGKYSNIEDIINDEEMQFSEGNKQFEGILDKSFQLGYTCLATAIKHNEFCEIMERKDLLEEIGEISHGKDIDPKLLNNIIVDTVKSVPNNSKNKSIPNNNDVDI